MNEEHLRRAIALAAEAREGGSPPFGSLLVGPDGSVLAVERNSSLTDDVLEHFTAGWLVFDGVAPWVKTIAGLQPSMRRADTGFRWAMPAPAAFTLAHPPLRLTDQRSAVELIGRHQTSTVTQSMTRALAHVPPLRDAMRFMRYSFTRG